MTAIGKGDFVEALRDDAVEGVLIHAGRVYVVEDCFRPDVCGPCDQCGNDTDVVLVEGVPIEPGWGWCPCLFKPVYRPKPDAFADLLKVPTGAPREPVAA